MTKREDILKGITGLILIAYVPTHISGYFFHNITGFIAILFVYLLLGKSFLDNRKSNDPITYSEKIMLSIIILITISTWIFLM